MEKSKSPENLGFLEQMSFATMGDLWDVTKTTFFIWLLLLAFIVGCTWLGDATGHPGKSFFEGIGIAKWNFIPFLIGTWMFLLRGQKMPYITGKDTVVIIIMGYLLVGSYSLPKYWESVSTSLWYSVVFGASSLVDKGLARWDEKHNPQDHLGTFEQKDEVLDEEDA